MEELLDAGYDPTQQIPGSFPTPEDLTPISSQSSNSRESPSATHSQQHSPRSVPAKSNSEEEVDLILSNNSAYQPMPRGVITRSRAWLLAQQQQQAETQLAEEQESTNHPQGPTLQTQGTSSAAENEVNNPQPTANHQSLHPVAQPQGNPTATVPVAQSAPAPSIPPNVPTRSTGVAAALQNAPAPVPNPNPVHITHPRRMLLADLPGRGECLAPHFDGDHPEELSRYFSEVESLFTRHAVTTKEDKKNGTLKYLTTASTERIWKLSDALTDPTKTYKEYKKEIHKLYPGSTNNVFTVQHLDMLVRLRTCIGIISALELGDYHCQFKVISKYLIGKNRMSQVEQTQAFMCGLQPELEQQVKQRLQLKKPNHNLQDPYDLEDIYDAASYVLQGMALVATSSLTSQCWISNLSHS